MAHSESEANGGGYFSSYSDLRVHELMLNDRPRTVAYRRFFEENRSFVKGKVVMDVGAGTGVLSLFAAAAGAKKVFAVEASNIAFLCKEVVSDNNYESIIEVIHDRVENIQLPEGTQVDIIVSEWMGFYLLHESMLDSVIYARDKFLSASGIMVPCNACLYVEPVDMTQHFVERAEYWSNLYGFDFSPIASSINMAEVSEPLIKCLEKSCTRSTKMKLLDLDLKMVTTDDVKSFCKTVDFSINEESRIHGFAFWFDVRFEVRCGNPLEVSDPSSPENSNKNDIVSNTAVDSVSNSGDAKHCEQNKKVHIKEDSAKSTSCLESTSSDSIVLSTGPSDLPTHWKQTIVFLPHTIMLMDGISLVCKINMAQDSLNKRHYNITLELGDGTETEEEQTSEEDSEDCSVEAEDSDDCSGHPTPCSCGSNRCQLISALVNKYDTEHQKLECEAENIETNAEVEAAKELDAQIEHEGWQMDSSNVEDS